jgi:hypothetical protein
MRVTRTLVAIAALSVLIFVACGGDSDDEPDPTSTVPAPTATEAPPPLVDVPGRPNAFADYPGVVGIYLTVAGSGVLGTPCLSDLIAEWEMAEPDGVPLTPEERCLLGNTDEDPEDEVVVLFTALSEGGFGLLSNVVVFDETPDGFVAVFTPFGPDQIGDVFPHAIIAAQDVTGDGNGELVYTDTMCGAHTCTLRVNIFGGSEFAYERLPPDEGLSMETAELFLEEDAEGETLIVLQGGTISSVGAGPQRERTEVYSWDGASFVLQSTTFGESDMLYFHILDADAVFDQSNFAVAAQRYRTAIADESLVETGFYENERAELEAYATFRIALSQFIVGELEAGAIAMLDQGVVDYAGTVNVGLIESFRAGYDATGNYPGGCLAVNEHLDANFDAFQVVWEYGYANPPFEPERFCPF